MYICLNGWVFLTILTFYVHGYMRDVVLKNFIIL